jgi:RHS repeat-associated protein
MGRTTTWGHDVQGRVTHKQYVDGARVSYRYGQTTGRMSQKIDEKLQVTQYNYNLDDTVSEVSYANARITTPPVSYNYDANYSRLTSMKDGTGTTRYSYHPITPIPGLGAGKLASIDGPLSDDIITYAYDELGRPVERGINSVISSVVFEAGNRVKSETDALGTFIYEYEGPSRRRSLIIYPNGQTATFKYKNNLSDQRLELITHTHGATLISEFSYDYDVPAERVTTWSQKSGSEGPVIYTFGYDAANQLTSCSGVLRGNVIETFAYAYDPSGNRLAEEIDGKKNEANYNALNQLTTSTVAIGAVAAYEWDAEHRIIAINEGNERTEYFYDGLSRRVRIRNLLIDVEVAVRHFVWCGTEICEERTVTGVVVKRFYEHGMKVETGTAVGIFFYTHDHLGSIRESTDTAGSVLTRFDYDPYGRRSPLVNTEIDFGFTGHFHENRPALSMTLYRVYDPSIGRWLSRDPLVNAEVSQGSNLYAYVGNNPINLTDPYGRDWLNKLARAAALIYELGQSMTGKGDPPAKDPPPVTAPESPAKAAYIARAGANPNTGGKAARWWR